MEKKSGETRERGKNFTEKEKEVAISIIEKYRSVLENKGTDASTLKDKKYTWERVAEEYNSTAIYPPRTAKQLKVLWSNLRRVARKTVAEENKKRYLHEDDFGQKDVEVLNKIKMEDEKDISKTGWGECNSQLSLVGARVLAMVEPQTRPLSNVYDEDNVYDRDLILSPTHEATVATSSSTSELDPLESLPGPSFASAGPLIRLETPPQDEPVQEIPAKQEKKQKKTTLQLKRTLYLKHIKLANMEINFKQKMYELELKIKQKELEKLNNS